MNLNKITPKREIENLLLSITKSCETLNKQTHTKPQETLEFQITKPRETLHFIPPISIKGSWMIDVVNLEVYNSIFIITEENNKSELYKFPDSKIGGISYEKVGDEIEKTWKLQILELPIYKMVPKVRLLLKNTEKKYQKKLEMINMNVLVVKKRSIFQDFEGFHRTEVDLFEEEIRLVLDE